MATTVSNMDKKIRAKPNPEIGVSEYHDILQSWLLSPPTRSMESRLGPVTAGDSRQVKPDMLCRIVDLIELLLQGGCPGVVGGTRLELALTRLVGSHPAYFEKKGQTLVAFPHAACNHIMSVLSLLRNMALEDEAATRCSSGRYNKTGGFRRNCDANLWKLLSPLLPKFALFVAKAEGEPAVKTEHGMSLVPVKSEFSASPAATDCEFSMDDFAVECDDGGWPTIFKKVLNAVPNLNCRHCARWHCEVCG